MKVAIVYTSGTGNTEEVATIMHSLLNAELFTVTQFKLSEMTKYDAIIIGTYTWGDGDIPEEMIRLYKAFELHDVKHVVTGIFGTGDSFYPKFCGAVDQFRDMLFVHTNLAVTLKIEQMPQLQDVHRCKKFVDSMLFRLEQKKSA
jgi:flavodoxin I